METYKLSIKERLQEGHKLLYAVCVDAPSLKYERLYDPNAKAKAFNSEDSEFDTSFSIVHPFRNSCRSRAKSFYFPLVNLKCLEWSTFMIQLIMVLTNNDKDYLKIF